MKKFKKILIIVLIVFLSIISFAFQFGAFYIATNKIHISDVTVSPYDSAHKFTVKYGDKTYLSVVSLFEDDDDFYNEYSLKKIEKKEYIVGTLWNKLTNNLGSVSFFEDDPNVYALYLVEPESFWYEEGLCLREDFVLPNVSTAPISAIYFADSWNSYDGFSDYSVKLEAEKDIQSFLKAIKNDELDKWIKLIFEKNSINPDDSFDIVVSYKDLPIWQNIASIEKKKIVWKSKSVTL